MGQYDENLLIVGPHSQSYEDLASNLGVGNVFFMDKVSYQQSLLLAVDVDVNIVIGNTGGLQIPGKLYLTLGVPLPLLYITQCIEDPAVDILKGLPGIYICGNNEVELEKAVAYIVSNYSNSKLQSEIRSRSCDVAVFEWGSIGAEFSRELLELMRKEK